MGVYLCLGEINIHNVDVNTATDFKEIKHSKIFKPLFTFYFFY